MHIVTNRHTLTHTHTDGHILGTALIFIIFIFMFFTDADLCQSMYLAVPLCSLNMFFLY